MSRTKEINIVLAVAFFIFLQIFFVKFAYSDGENFIGAGDSSVVMVEYASLTCPYCKTFHDTSYKKLKENYIDNNKIKFIYRDFPLDNLGLAAAMIARCMPAEKFYKFIGLLFKEQEIWAFGDSPKKELVRLASFAGMSEQEFNSCLENKSLVDKILEGRENAIKEYDVAGTPTFIINGERLDVSPEDYEIMAQKIDELLGE